jgi:hypothetical protein
MTYCRLHARYACQPMPNEALTVCEPGPPYLDVYNDNKKKKKSGGRSCCQHKRFTALRKKKDQRTLGRERGTLSVQSRPCVGDGILSRSTLRDEKKRRVEVRNQV